MITQYNNLETGTWKVVSGPSINPVAPTSYVPVITPSGIRLFVAGPAYAGALVSQTLPVPPNTGQATFWLEVNPDEAVAVNGQALEFDLIVAIGGNNYNGSFQINYAEDGMLQIAKADGSWIDTGIKVPLLSANSWTRIGYSLRFDTTNKTFSIINIFVGNNTYTVPSTLQNVPAQKLGWTDGITVQLQSDLNKNGGAMSHCVRNIAVIVS